jgi:hypothetical protein
MARLADAIMTGQAGRVWQLATERTYLRMLVFGLHRIGRLSAAVRSSMHGDSSPNVVI